MTVVKIVRGVAIAVAGAASLVLNGSKAVKIIKNK